MLPVQEKKVFHTIRRVGGLVNELTSRSKPHNRRLIHLWWFFLRRLAPLAASTTKSHYATARSIIARWEGKK